jgi:hypothetical protein
LRANGPVAPADATALAALARSASVRLFLR